LRTSASEDRAESVKGRTFSGGSGLYDAAALVLAGGRGKRAGGTKLFLSLDGTPIIEKVLSLARILFPQVILSCRGEDAPTFSRIFAPLFPGLALKIVADRREGLGPLEGISLGLASSDHPWIFVFGCDMPMVQESVVRFMASKRDPQKDAVIARLGGFVEPLHAFYHKRCVSAVDDAILKGEHRVSSFLPKISAVIVEEEEISHIPGFRRSFMNINTPEDMKRWQEKAFGRF
jgi:molybdopterin-guanine dinucleotide biosynthesis protein A